MLKPARELTNDQAFELDPDIEGVARFLPARRRDDGDAVAAQFHETFGGELAERVARDRAAHAEAFAERILRQLGARLQRLLDDRAAQRSADRPDLVRRCLPGRVARHASVSAVESARL